MRKFLTVSLVVFSTASAFAADKGEIKRFRFQRHAKQDFERLVMEFGGNGKGAVPTVKVTPQAGEKNAQISVDGFTLVGAIPEAAMNESFGGRSKYLGALALNTDKADSLFIKTNLKDAKVQIDAFWLESPSRLVVDAFPASSPRAAGPAVLEDRGTASSATVKPAAPTEHAANHATAAEHKAEVAGPAMPATHASKKKGHHNKSQFVCYATNSQVVASVSYEDPTTKTGMSIETDGTTVTSPNSTNQDRVACFPKNSFLKAKITVQGEEVAAGRGPKGPDEPKRPSVAAVAPVSPAAPGRVHTPEAVRHPSSGHHKLAAPAEMGKVPAPEHGDEKVANKDGGEEGHEAPEQH